MFKSTMSAVLLIAGLSFAFGAQAADLSHDMHQLKSGYKAFSKAGNAATSNISEVIYSYI